MSKVLCETGHSGKKVRLRKNGILHELLKNKTIYLMMLPGILFFFIFAYIPMVGVIMAFKDYNIKKGIFGSSWNGLDNFKFFFSSGDAFRITFNTVYMNLLFLIFSTVISVALAIFLNGVTKKVFKKVTQSVMFLPYFVSWAIVGIITQGFFASENGAINSFLKSINMEPVSWNSSPELWPFILVIFYLWKWCGYNVVIYLATITGFDTECFEAAAIDGASKFQQIRYITIPLLMPTIIILTLLQIGKIFYGDFGMFYSIIGDNGILYATTDVIDTYVYRALRLMSDFGMASAVGLYQSLMCFVMVFGSNLLVRKYQSDAALF
ncbi:MAG TPA: sugar ABC transporter permease [Clostridiaceae bacterium]|nr:sugar ABC transporter permease [Clostridiaceae bacterium]